MCAGAGRLRINRRTRLRFALSAQQIAHFAASVEWVTGILLVEEPHQFQVFLRLTAY
uniref:Uncharacterized protein n=1 Tax=Candidatus Kentrum sp. TC TaxID=2126339 RepID=A0A450YYC0_9GAMM|nr:MAG: hypothetical protein BECKTC1821E_GA0114239_10661 [Candidatus Kentron sp. TC]